MDLIIVGEFRQLDDGTTFMRPCAAKQSRQLFPSGGILWPTGNDDVLYQPTFQFPAPSPNVDFDPVFLDVRTSGQDQPEMRHSWGEQLPAIRQTMAM